MEVLKAVFKKNRALDQVKYFFRRKTHHIRVLSMLPVTPAKHSDDSDQKSRSKGGVGEGGGGGGGGGGGIGSLTQ